MPRSIIIVSLTSPGLGLGPSLSLSLSLSSAVTFNIIIVLHGTNTYSTFYASRVPCVLYTYCTYGIIPFRTVPTISTMPASPPPPPSPSLSSSSSALLSSLHTTLNTLAASPYPHVTGPEPLRKRASVALIIRVQPQYDHWPAASSNPTRAPIRDIDSFFDQDWVKHGDPQVLFIKRAARKGDRWTSHVALPGGRRDPEDADDLAAAVRETSEEVGIHLTPENAIAVGNLPQRVVTTSWGKVP